MDIPPQFLYHHRDHSRYIPPPPPPPPPHHLFPDDLNFHGPPIHHRDLQHIPERAVDFPIPPPSHSPYRHFPMPPPTSPAPPLAYDPSQPQFNVPSSNHDDYLRIPDDRMRAVHPFRDFPRSPPGSGRIPFNPREFLDHTDNRAFIPRSPVDFEREAYYGDERSGVPCSWPGGEYDDGFPANPAEEVLRGRDDQSYYRHDRFQTGPDGSFMESGGTNAQNRLSSEIAFVSGSYDRDRYGSTSEKETFRRRRVNGVCKNQRWVHSKQNSRNVHNSFREMGNNDRGDGDHGGFRTGKHGYYRPELGKHYNNDNKGSTEGYHEYTSSPRKPIQKKSALLRIQAENPSRFNNEQLLDSECFDNNSSLRCKNQVRSLVFRMDEEKKREETPMELDVSFKSNSLVAKAVVASSQSGAVSDVGIMPKNEKISEVLVPGHNFMDSPLNGQTKKDVVSTGNVTHLTTHSSGSKDELKESGEKVRGFLADNKSHSSNDKSSLGKTNIQSSSQGKVLGKEVKTVLSAKVPTTRVTKKKKVVRKVVKKVVSSQLGPLTKTGGDGPVKVDGLINSTLVVGEFEKGSEVPKKKNTVSGTSSLHLVSTASQKEISGSLENKKADQLLLPLASEKSETKIHIGKKSTSNDKSDNNSSDSLIPLNSSIKKGRGTRDLLEKNSSVIARSPLLNVNKVPKLLNGRKELDFKSVKSKKVRLGEAEATRSSLDDSQSGLLSSKDPYPHGHLVDGNRLTGSSDIPMNFDDRVTQSQDNEPLSETCFFDEIRKQASPKKMTATPNTDIIGVPLAESNSLVAGMQVDSLNLGCYHGNNQQTKRGSNDCCNSSDVQVNAVLFHCESIDNSREQAFMDRGSIELGTSPQERSPRTKVSVSGGEGEKAMSGTSTSPRKVNDETLSSKDLCVSSTSKNYHPSEHDISGHGNKVLGAKSTITGDIHGFSLLGKALKNKVLVNSSVSMKPNEKSHECRKKQKICVASPVLPCPNAKPKDGTAIAFTSRPEDTLTSNGEFMEREEAAASTVDAVYTTSSTDCSKGIDMFLDDELVKEPASKINIDNDLFEYGLKYKNVEENSCPVEKELIVSQSQPVYSPALANGRKENGSPMMARDKIKSMDINSDRKRKLDIYVPKEKSMVCNETDEWKDSSEVPFSQTINCLQPVTGKTSDNLGQDNLHHLQNHMALSDAGNRCSTAISHNEIMGCMFDSQVDRSSPETYNVLGIHKPNCEALLSHIDSKMDCTCDRKADEKPVVEDKLIPSTDSSLPQCTFTNEKLGHAGVGSNLSSGKMLPSALEESKNRVQTQIGSSDPRKKNQTGYYKSSSSYIASKKSASAAHITKPRSWHRNVNSLIPPPGTKAGSSTVPPRGQLHGRDGMLQSTSYIRKGNSLVRKSPPVVAQAWGSQEFSSNSSHQHDSKTSIKAYKVDATSSPVLFKAKGIDTSVDKPYSPPLSSGSRSPNQSISLKDFAPSSCLEIESDPMKSKHISDLSRSSEDPSKILLAPKSQTVCADKIESQTEAKGMNSVSSIEKKIVYVKRKSNQLVATSNSHDLSTNSMESIHSSHADGYYKRSKNQLIRASLESQMKCTFSNGKISKPGVQSSSGNGGGGSFYKRQLRKAKTHRPSKNSLVWTLCNSVAPGNGDRNSQNQKIVPLLFPWKRQYWRTLQSNTLTHKNSSSTIVRKLLLLRNRKTLYKRSKHGLSIRKSRVVSIGRSSLKWSKSIERRSKKANQEATRAVVDAEKNKRECNWDTLVCYGAQGGNQCSYDKSSYSNTHQSEKGAKKFCSTRRLVIGNDEYVKIGKGNQLVRNPKIRARILANEKIRWSLHTARQRLAKKRKYCQFFTRFGKCDKDGGKCPYIHDTSKIAVCTKFINGLCSNPSCKLTHKVIPERMPDCSYFLQGLCSSRNCAYRHVNVNPKATTCEAFLRGYCALGNECRKKHSYVCPVFEATGTCPEGSRCKLHHPKKQTKGRKRKKSERKNSERGRYFGSKRVDPSGSRVVVTEKHPGKSSEGDVAAEDYISLDASDEEVEEANESTTARTSFSDDYLFELFNDLDELIKPVRIMNRNPSMWLPEDSGGRTESPALPVR